MSSRTLGETMTAALDAARRALEAADSDAALQAASEAWEVGAGLLRQGEAPDPEELAEARRLVDACLLRAEELRGELFQQLDAAGSSRRALDAYSR